MRKLTESLYRLFLEADALRDMSTHMFETVKTMYINKPNKRKDKNNDIIAYIEASMSARSADTQSIYSIVRHITITHFAYRLKENINYREVFNAHKKEIYSSFKTAMKIILYKFMHVALQTGVEVSFDVNKLIKFMMRYAIPNTYFLDSNYDDYSDLKSIRISNAFSDIGIPLNQMECTETFSNTEQDLSPVLMLGIINTYSTICAGENDITHFNNYITGSQICDTFSIVHDIVFKTPFGFRIGFYFVQDLITKISDKKISPFDEFLQSDADAYINAFVEQLSREIFAETFDFVNLIYDTTTRVYEYFEDYFDTILLDDLKEKLSDGVYKLFFKIFETGEIPAFRDIIKWLKCIYAYDFPRPISIRVHALTITQGEYCYI